MSGRIFITSDLHFGHQRDFLYVPRGFSSIEEHDAVIIKNWNEIVNDKDEVYILGDLVMNNLEHGIDCLTQLKGQKKFIAGNHDSGRKIDAYIENWYEYCGYADFLKYKKWNFYLSHYPTITNNLDDEKKSLKGRLINLCGHSHTKDKFVEFKKGILSYHVELDCQSNKPVFIDDIINDIQNYFITKRRSLVYDL